MIRPDLSRKPPSKSLDQGDVTLLTARCIMRQLTQDDEAPSADTPHPQIHNRRSEDRKPGEGATPSYGALHNDQKSEMGEMGEMGAKPLRALDIPVDDWDHLFRAVETRLKNTMGDLLAKTQMGPQLELVVSTHAVVFECMAALDHLHSALSHERDLQQQFEITVFSAQNSLAKALSLLVDIQMQESHKAMHSRTEAVASNDTRSLQKPIPYVPLYDALIAAKARRRALALVQTPDTGVATGGEGLRH